jgi:uncharacterized protein GlcG (DUF336 family)
MRHALPLCVAVAVLFGADSARAEDVLTVKTIGLDLARDIADEAVRACREMDYQVSVVVVARSAQVRAALRDDLAPRFTLQIAEQKANAAIMAGLSSGEFRRNREDVRQEMNHVDGILLMQGALTIEAGGARIGAVGVSGAPSGETDDLCARKALDALFDRIQFAQ